MLVLPSFAWKIQLNRMTGPGSGLAYLQLYFLYPNPPGEVLFSSGTKDTTGILAMALKTATSSSQLTKNYGVKEHMLNTVNITCVQFLY